MKIDIRALLLIGVAVIAGCGDTIANPAPTQAAQETRAYDDSLGVTVEKRDVSSDGHGNVVAILYDYRANGVGVDIICTAITGYGTNPQYGSYVSISCVHV